MPRAVTKHSTPPLEQELYPCDTISIVTRIPSSLSRVWQNKNAPQMLAHKCPFECRVSADLALRRAVDTLRIHHLPGTRASSQGRAGVAVSCMLNLNHSPAVLQGAAWGGESDRRRRDSVQRRRQRSRGGRDETSRQERGGMRNSSSPGYCERKLMEAPLSTCREPNETQRTKSQRLFLRKHA